MNYQEIFEERGELYNLAHKLYPQARVAESDMLIRWLEPVEGEKIVVAAAGGGFDALAIEAALKPKNAQIICVEPSLKFASQIPNRFEVYHHPINSIPIADESADRLVCLAALHHILDRDSTFDEWSRVLKPGGRLVLADVEAGSSNGEFLNI